MFLKELTSLGGKKKKNHHPNLNHGKNMKKINFYVKIAFKTAAALFSIRSL